MFLPKVYGGEGYVDMTKGCKEHEQGKKERDQREGKKYVTL